MTNRMTQKDAAELIFDVWANHLDEGLSQVDTLAETGLSRPQFQRGKDWLRDELCSNKEMPYSYDPVANVYRLNVNFEPVHDYWIYRLKVTAKQLQRLLDGSGSPAKAKFGERLFGRLHRDTARLIEDLADIIG